MIDIKDSLWVPRLILGKAVEVVENLGKTKSDISVDLPMEAIKENYRYPRPQLERDSFLCLNGDWLFVNEDSETMPEDFPLTIRVPFAPQAFRSGIKEEVKDSFWYRKSFSLEEGFIKDRVLLNFGAVDQIAKVYVNKKFVGEHAGGYLPFSFDITDYIFKDAENEISLYVKDSLDSKYPYGKQVKKPGGMWYTQVSGIWQTVWIESVYEEHIEGICFNFDGSKLDAMAEGNFESARLTVYSELECLNEIAVFDIKPGHNELELNNPRLWSPENPNLYGVRIEAGRDQVKSYFALRYVSIEEINGIKRICLNGRPYFFHGVLDQGYFSDGIYTPPSDQWYERDILSMKELGFNTLRKHIKVEPARFYYDCDRLGMIVFQDMVNNGPYSYLRETLFPTFFGQWKRDDKSRMTEEAKAIFVSHSKELVGYLKGFACVVYYTVFNEGWGQFDSQKVTQELKKIDDTRIYDSASGWFKPEVTDVDSDHFYFHKIKPHRWSRPVVISECGGFVRTIKDHSYYPDRVYGYGICKDEKELTDTISNIYTSEVIPNIKGGICGTIYTQLSDVEEELNGLYTYDRAVLKVNKAGMKALADQLFAAFDREIGSTER